MKCIICKKEFVSKRNDAQFCSPNCRQYAKRNLIKQTPVLVFNKTPKVVQTDTVEEFEKTEPKKNSTKKITVSENPFKNRVIDPVEYERKLKAFEKMGLEKVKFISTGIKDFDELTMIPRGRITQIQGPSSVGKTTLCLNMAAGMSKIAKVLYIDTEASLNPELMTLLDIDDKNFTLYNTSSFLEDIYEVIKKASKSGEYDVVILDSLAMTTTRAIDEGEFTASNIGQKAKLVHKLISLTQMDFKNSDTAFVVINQEREFIGGYVPMKYTPGGMGPVYAASLIVALKTIKSWRFPKDAKNGLYEGHEVEATIIKSKVNQPWRIKKFKLYYPNPIAEVQPQF